MELVVRSRGKSLSSVPLLSASEVVVGREMQRRVEPPSPPMSVFGYVLCFKKGFMYRRERQRQREYVCVYVRTCACVCVCVPGGFRRNGQGRRRA